MAIFGLFFQRDGRLITDRSDYFFTTLQDEIAATALFLSAGSAFWLVMSSLISAVLNSALILSAPHSQWSLAVLASTLCWAAELQSLMKLSRAPVGQFDGAAAWAPSDRKAREAARARVEVKRIMWMLLWVEDEQRFSVCLRHGVQLKFTFAPIKPRICLSESRRQHDDRSS